MDRAQDHLRPVERADGHPDDRPLARGDRLHLLRRAAGDQPRDRRPRARHHPGQARHGLIHRFAGCDGVIVRTTVTPLPFSLPPAPPAPPNPTAPPGLRGPPPGRPPPPPSAGGPSTNLPRGGWWPCIPKSPALTPVGLPPLRLRAMVSALRNTSGMTT